MTTKAKKPSSVKANKGLVETTVALAPPVSKSVQKRQAAQRKVLKASAPAVTEADVLRIVREFQTRPLISAESAVGEAGRTKSNKTLPQTTIPMALGDLNDAIGNMRSAFSDLQAKLEPVLGPMMPTAAEDSGTGESSSSSATLDRVRSLMHDINNTTEWILNVRNRVEL